METYNDKPIKQSYRAAERLYAGEYPGDKGQEKAMDKLKAFLAFGITHFVDLTEEGELTPYAHLLPEGVMHRRFPIVDVSVPDSCEEMQSIVDYINESLNSSPMAKVYVHCWGGVGRTGTVIGCYYAYQGCGFTLALQKLRVSFKQCPKSVTRKSPETMEQEMFISRYADYVNGHKGMEPSVKENEELKEMKKAVPERDRVRGSLVGGAIGDALGYAVEFDSYSAITHHYGSEGISRYDMSCNWGGYDGSEGKALISDDTQMTLFTACGILNARKTGKQIIHSICSAYLEWYHTQTGKSSKMPKDCWIKTLPEMNQLRAPGNTCMSALYAISNGHEPHNNSKGCGGVMRVAPVALFGLGEGRFLDIEQMDRIAADAAEMTHQHPLGYIPAALMAHVVYRLATDDAPTCDALVAYVEEGLDTLDRLFSRHANSMEYMRMLVKKAFEMASSDLPDPEAVEIIGGGWVGEEALAIALYCAVKHFDDFERAMVAAVNHSGDSDSTGAITGNILGAAIGYDALPEFYKKDLELHDVILAVADDLWEGKQR